MTTTELNILKQARAILLKYKLAGGQVMITEPYETFIDTINGNDFMGMTSLDIIIAYHDQTPTSVIDDSKTTMQIILTNEEKEQMFFDAICNALHYMQGYGLEFETFEPDYQAARQKLTNPCYEDVLMQMLRDGRTIKCIDIEGDGAYSVDITLQMVHDGMDKVPAENILNMKNGTDDVIDADVILQTVMFGEIIFG